MLNSIFDDGENRKKAFLSYVITVTWNCIWIPWIFREGCLLSVPMKINSVRLGKMSLVVVILLRIKNQFWYIASVVLEFTCIRMRSFLYILNCSFYIIWVDAMCRDFIDCHDLFYHCIIHFILSIKQFHSIYLNENITNLNNLKK